MRSPLFEPSVIVLVALVMIAWVWMRWPHSELPVLLFLLICPGLSFVQMLDLEDHATVMTLSVALSIAITTLVATSLLIAGAWHRENGVLAIALICLTGVALRARQLGGRGLLRGHARDGG